MTAYWIIGGLLVIFVTLLLRAEFAKNLHQIYLFKPLSTILVICTALLPLLFTQRASHPYFYLIVIGLFFSLAGDIALMGTTKKYFILGLVFFLITHVFYSFAFSISFIFVSKGIVFSIALLLFACFIYAYLYPGLDQMKMPVLVYVIIISVMMHQALFSLNNESISHHRALLIVFGAALFYISDLILAINKFRRPVKYHRISLAFYYSGQFLVALSIGE